MTKLTLTNVANLQNESSAVTTMALNNAATITAVENTLSRDGTLPNHMNADFDMNSNRIINLPDATTDQEPATYSQLVDAVTAVGSGAVVDAQYVTMATNGTLLNERVLTAGNHINIVDGGAGSTVTIDVNETTLNADTATLTNKTIDLASNTLTGTRAEFNTALSDDNFATLTGTETLSNKTLVAPALGTPASGVMTNVTGLPISTGVSGLAAGVATFLETPTSANLASAVTDETGSGSLVFATSPTLVTPALGTPASGTLTNATGLPISTGVSGLGAGVATFLGTPSSANLASAVTGETGTGALVFGTSPTLVTPALGTPSSAVLTNATGLPLTTGVTGNLPVTNLNSGTSASASTFWRGDGTWSTPAGGGTVTSSGTPLVGQIPVWTSSTDIKGINWADTPRGRLTLQTGTPVMTTSSMSATTIYYTPYIGNMIPIYNGTTMIPTPFAEISVATTDTAKNPAAIGNSKVNDWFVWDDGGTLRLSHGPDWTSDTVRSAGTALVRVNGILLNSVSITNGPAASRGTYVGTTRSNGANALDWRIAGSASGGTAGLYAVWNTYNRVHVAAVVIDSGASYTYTSVSFRQARASAGNQISFVSGLEEEGISASYIARIETVAASSAFAQIVPALDTTTTPTTLASAWVNISAVATTTIHSNSLNITPQLGFHYIAALEGSDGTNANVFGNTGKNTLTAIFLM